MMKIGGLLLFLGTFFRDIANAAHPKNLQTHIPMSNMPSLQAQTPKLGCKPVLVTAGVVVCHVGVGGRGGVRRPGDG